MKGAAWITQSRTPSPGTPGEGRGEGDFLTYEIRPHPSPLPEYRARGHERWASPILWLMVLLIAAAGAAPATQSTDDLSRWVNDLGNHDAIVRETARDHLIALRREDLPALIDAVRASPGMLPGQVSNLHDIVLQVYLAGEEYEKKEAGFLGVTLAPEDEVVMVADRPMRGVRIISRWPGFTGYRYLQDGDLVLKVEEFPDAVEGRMEFPVRVRSRRPGETLTFQILRQGQLLRIKIPIDARPGGDDEQTMMNMMRERLQKAEQYWADNLLPAVR